MGKSRLSAVLLFLFSALLARATSVEPPEFPGLVGGADAIYRGRVASVDSRRVDRPGGSVIRTYVTFVVEETLKGEARAEVVLDFLGGTVGDLTLEVSDVPQFVPGDRDFVFVQGNGRQFCPLVAVMHGRYRILRDAAAHRDYVARENRRPLNDVREVAQPMAEGVAAAADSSRALTPAEFSVQVLRQVSANPVQHRQ